MIMSSLPPVVNNGVSGGTSFEQGIMAGNSSSVMPMYPRSKSILDHLQECKRENNERLKQVKNLDELVMFKLTTVADKIKEEHGKDGLEVMGLDMFQKICDPLLANHSNFKSLSKKTAMLNSKKLNPASALESSYLPFSDHDAKHNGFESGVSKNINELNLSTQLGMLPSLNNDTLLMETQTSKQQKGSIMKSADRRISQSGLPSVLSDDDPVRFLQQYFKKSNEVRQVKVTHANYFMERHERKYGQYSALKKTSAMSMVTDESPNKGGLLNSESETQLQSQLMSLSGPDMDYRSSSYGLNAGGGKIVTQGAASFYSFAKPKTHDQNGQSQQASQAQNEDPSNRKTMNENSGGVESLNVLNFNKMKDELQKMFEVDQFQSSNHASQDFNNSGENLAGQSSLLTNEKLADNKNVDQFQREVVFRNVVRSNEEDDLTSAAIPGVESPYGVSPINSTMNRQDLLSSHSHGKATFGTVRNQGTSMAVQHQPVIRVRHQGTSDESLINYRNYFGDYVPQNQPAKKAVLTTDDKIRQILMNEEPDEETVETQLNYLSNIAEVRSIGFQRFRYQLLQQRLQSEGTLGLSSQQENHLQAYQPTRSNHHKGEGISRSQMSAYEHQPRHFSQQHYPLEYHQHNTNLNLSAHQSIVLQEDNIKTSKRHSAIMVSRQPYHQAKRDTSQILAREFQTELMRFNTNKNFEALQESMKKKSAVNSMAGSALTGVRPADGSSDLPPEPFQMQEGAPQYVERSDYLYDPLRIEHNKITNRRNMGVKEFNSHRVVGLPAQDVPVDLPYLDDLRSDIGSPVNNAPEDITSSENVDVTGPRSNNTLLDMQQLEREMMDKEDLASEGISNQQLQPIPAPVLNVDQGEVEKQEAAKVVNSSGKVSFMKKRSTMQYTREVHPTAEIRIEGPPELVPQQSLTGLPSSKEVAASTSMLNLQPLETPQAIQKRSDNLSYFRMMKQQFKAQKHVQSQQLSHESSKLSPFQAALDNQSYLMLEQFSDDIQNQLIDLAMSKRKAWSPRRFKKFPRFTIFLNRGEDEETEGAKEYLKEHIISLNPEFMNLLLNSNANQSSEQAAQSIEQALASINYPQRMQNSGGNEGDGSSGYRFQDPFDRVLLTKGIDNQILTSFRTLTKANNVVSDTLKVVHNKFNPTPMAPNTVARMRKAYNQQLYVINEEALGQTIMSTEGDEESEIPQQKQSPPVITPQTQKQVFMQQQKFQLKEPSQDSIMNQSEDHLRSVRLAGEDAQNISGQHTTMLLDSSQLQSPKNESAEHKPPRSSATQKSIVYQQQSAPKIYQPQKSPSSRLAENSLNEDITIDVQQQQQRFQSQMDHHKDNEDDHLLLNVPVESKAGRQKSVVKSNEGNVPQKSAIVLQKIDPSEMFGMSKHPTAVVIPQGMTSFTKTFMNNDTHYYQMHDTYGSVNRWQNSMPSPHMNPINLGGTSLQQPSLANDAGGHQNSLTIEQVSTIQQQQQESINTKMTGGVLVVQGKKDSQQPSKKKQLTFAGGFQAYNMPGSQPNHQSNVRPCGQNVSQDKRFNPSALSTIKNILTSSTDNLAGGKSSIPTANQFMDSLKEEEKQQLAQKLTLPPVSTNKLKHMIDDLYQKEKKYVKQYLREDYIEKNNFIFNLQKSHALDTTKAINHTQQTQQENNQGFIGGLYSISAPMNEHQQPNKKQNS